ncbi:hypothetical protein D3C71_1795340 [compost metagenome]
MAKKGMPHQTLAMIGPHIAYCGSDKILPGWLIRPRSNSQCGIGPMTGLNSHAQLRPAKKEGTAHGRNTSACTRPRPMNGLSSKSARMRPKVNCRNTEAPVHHSVFFNAV